MRSPHTKHSSIDIDDTPIPAPPDAPVPSRFAPLNLPLVLVIRLYRLTLSPFIGMHCRHIPTCSQYALEACHWHHPPRAVWLIARRLLACRPGGRAGYDPIPLPETPTHDRNRQGQ